jgi:Beta-propeller repeat
MFAPTFAHRMSPIGLAALGALLTLAAVLVLHAAPPAPPVPDPAGDRTVARAAPPVMFMPNAGQAAAGVRYEARGPGGALLFTGREVVLAGTGVRLRFAGAAPRPVVAGVGRRNARVNVLVGERARWRTNLPAYRAVAYRGLYPGVEARFAGPTAAWTVAPHADPARIGWRYAGAAGVAVQPGTGALEVALRGRPGRSLSVPPPVAWQWIAGRRMPVDARYVVREDGEVGFALGRHDRGALLLIAPSATVAARLQAAPTALAFSTFLGGIHWDEAMDVEVDRAGATYVAGFTQSPDIRRARPAQASHGGVFDAYVAKLSPDGRALVYATFLGGNEVDVANALAVDQAGNAYVAGRTNSANFPTRRAMQPRLRGRACQALGRHDFGVPCPDAFVTKLGPSGALVFSTYLGGSRDEEGVGLAVDRRGRAYVAGDTTSGDLPTHSAVQRRLRSRRCISDVPCPGDAFVAALDRRGRALRYLTYLGGEKTDTAGGIAVDRTGNAYVTGSTNSPDFPTRRARQRALTGRACGPPPNVPCHDAFVAKLRPDGRALEYSTLLGGSKPERGTGIAIDGRGSAYVTGSTESPDFPLARPLQGAIGNGSCLPSELCADAFVTKFSPDGRRLAYSTFLGGNAEESGLGIAVDPAGGAHVVGSTDSHAFRTLAPVQPAIGGGIDAFAARLAPSGALAFSTFLGGTEAERANAVAVDASGRDHLAGRTLSPNFPTAAPMQPALASDDYDMFVTVLR